jgi:hypothetical protein
MSSKRKDQKNKSRGEHFAALVRTMMETPAWRALSPVAQALYPWLKIEWHGPKANNNGTIRLSVQQAANRLGVNSKTAMRAFHDLQAKGFIHVTESACLGVGGEARSPALELTELPLPGAVPPVGRRLYAEWVPGHDFAVVRANVNNPFGAAGKAKSQSKKRNGAIPKSGTVAR